MADTSRAPKKITRMDAGDVLVALRALTEAGIAWWINGGWGVDALVGRQTRPHDDLDLVIGISDVERAIDTLKALDFLLDEDERPVSFTMGTTDGQKVDFHPVTWNEDGAGIQAQPNDSSWTYPADGFRGVGQIGGQPVRCLTAEVQILCHAGYQLDAGDEHDLELMRSVLSDPSRGAGT